MRYTNSAQPNSDCSWRISQIRVHTVCQSTKYFEKQPHKKQHLGQSVQNFRTFTVLVDGLLFFSAFKITLSYSDLWYMLLYLPHNSGGVLWFHVGRPCVRPSVHPSVIRPSVFRFQMITWVNINGFSPNLVCALILWRSGLGLLMGKFCQIFTELSAQDMPICSFPGDNFE